MCCPLVLGRFVVFGLLLSPTSARAVTRDEVLDRAQAWVDDGVPYSYSAWYTDPSTGACCYRTDCSGFVSAVWGLAPPGHTTYSFGGGVWDDGLSYVISSADLLPGDALNYPGDPAAGTGHIMLYVSGSFSAGWVEVYEEYSSGSDAAFHWRSIDPSIYLPIRYTGIEDCSEEICDGVDNDCDGRVDENAATEVCNGVDDDCDGEVDEDWICDMQDAAGLAAWRADLGSSTDVDGDGRADVCMRGTAGLDCYASATSGFERLATLRALSDEEGFDGFDNYTTLRMADVTGDGLADVCARHDTEGFRCWPATGAGFGSAIQGPALTDAMGWADPSNYSTFRMADLDGDGRADLCARADAGLRCWLSDGLGFPTAITGPELSDALGWDNEKYYATIRLADLNGDGRADLCARSSAGMECWLFDGSSFATHIDGPELSNAAGWGEPKYYLTLAMPDVDGDGRADLCARSTAGIRCWRSNGAGFDGIFAGPELSDALGWGAYPYLASLRWSDVTGDGRDDLCARGVIGVYCWPSTGAGFADHFLGPELSNDAGWLDPANFLTLESGDLDADGLADLCVRADAGLRCWRADGSGFPDGLEGPGWSDALGWGSEKFYSTFRFGGGTATQADTSADTGGLPPQDTGDGVAPLDTGPGEDPPDRQVVSEAGCGCSQHNARGGSLGLWGLLCLVLPGLRRQPGPTRRGFSRGIGIMKVPASVAGACCPSEPGSSQPKRKLRAGCSTIPSPGSV